METLLKQEQELNDRQMAEAIVARMPEADYRVNFQVPYDSEEALVDSIREARSTEGVTAPRQSDALLHKFGQIALGQLKKPVIILDGCNESVRIRKDAEHLSDLEADMSKLVKKAMLPLALVAKSLLKHAVLIERNRGQSTKPRSNMMDGDVLSYMGDAINDRARHKRTPDPTRIPASVIQARDLERGLTEAVGHHVPAAHEFLNLPLEMSQLIYDQKTNQIYSKGGDLLWLGVRTGDPDGPHVELLGQLGNPVAAKVGAITTPDRLIALNERLNPNKIPGKVTYMMRFGLDELIQMEAALDAIAEHAPEALIMWDIHGSTEQRPDGTKIRAVSTMLKGIKVLSLACRRRGLLLHGLHLETIDDDNRLECVDTPDQKPSHLGNVDPGLNPKQTLTVLDEAVPYLL